MTKTQKSASPKSAPVAKKSAAPKPAIEAYGFRSAWTGPSDAVNKNHSRTKVDPSKFNAYPNGNITQRDTDAMAALKAQFKGDPFQRRNVDAGILRRLIERGRIEHVSGSPNELTGTFRLTKAGLGQ